MKQLFKSLVFVATAATLLAGCSKSNNDDPIPAAPSMVWEGNDLDAVHEITDVMSIQIKMSIPGGLQKLQLEIDSPALTPEMLGMVDLTTKMDLANPDNDKMEAALKEFKLPAGKGIQGSTEQLFDISTLVPLIKAIYQDNSEHKFKVTITDAKNQTITKTLKFHLTKGPAIIWDGHDFEDLHEITDGMSIKINILTSGGLEKLELGIESPALTDELLGELGLSTKMDLTNPASAKMEESLKALGLPAGASLKGATEQLFDISTLVPMIKAIYQESSEHKFSLTVTDKLGEKASQTLRFHLTGPSSVTYNKDADLWKNTATLSAVVRSEGEVKIEYRKKGAADWQQAAVTKGEGNAYSAAIAPTWKAEGQHATGVDQFSLDNATGIFAGSSYEYRLTVAGTELDKGEFEAADGQTIPGGNMQAWEQVEVELFGTKAQIYRVAANHNGVPFWGSGNNVFTQKLCQPETLSENHYAAKVKGELAFGSVFAAGNLFSGIFDMEGMKGYARFGQKYEYTARPSALKVRIKTSINTITWISDVLTPPNGVKKGDTDPSRIFVCITDWTAPHSVCSGIISSNAEVNAFDPVSDKAEPAEGKVLAYGSKTFTQSIGNWQEVIIPILYKDKEAKPAKDNYSFVLSCASSAYGDYLWGCPENELNIEYIEWVY